MFSSQPQMGTRAIWKVKAVCVRDVNHITTDKSRWLMKNMVINTIFPYDPWIVTGILTWLLYYIIWTNNCKYGLKKIFIYLHNSNVYVACVYIFNNCIKMCSVFWCNNVFRFCIFTFVVLVYQGISWTIFNKVMFLLTYYL
jgi:hypothetical protein